MVSKLQGTWFRSYRVHGFEDTGMQGMGYVVSHYPLDDTLMGSVNETFD